VDRREALTLGGLALLGAGALMALQNSAAPASSSSSPPTPAPGPSPTPKPAPAPTPTPAPAQACRWHQTVGHFPDWDGSLWGIATHYYGNGALYPRIYAANLALIEATARAHGFGSSEGGHWIFPGEVLCVP
jgi:nucleoid-associated protein YgaU